MWVGGPGRVDVGKWAWVDIGGGWWTDLVSLKIALSSLKLAEKQFERYDVEQG